MAAAGALGVIHVDGAAANGRQRVLHETGFVQGVGMQLDLEIHFIGDGEAGVDGGGHRSPVLVDLQAEAAGCELLAQRFAAMGVAAPEEAEIQRPCFGRLQHFSHVEGPPASIPTVIGPSEPPINVVMPLAMACSQRPAESKCT